MNQIVMLDALYPPSPDQLVRDLDAAGAAACAVYCWRPGGIGNWTRAHVDRLHAADKLVMGIVVPPGNGGAPAVFLDAVAAMGILPGEPVGLDIEPPNTPPPTWEETFDVALKARGYVELDYGTQMELGLYEPDDNEWVAMWLRTGRLDPLPTMPTGWQAWQFVNDIEVNGSQYDASIIDRGLWPAGSGAKEDHMTDDQIRVYFRFLYRMLCGRFVNDADVAEIETKWLPAFKADPIKADFDFGNAAAAEVDGKDVLPVRRFELSPNAARQHRHPDTVAAQTVTVTIPEQTVTVTIPSQMTETGDAQFDPSGSGA